MRNAGLDEAQAGIKIARRNINNLRYAEDTTLMAENKELESILMKMKGESEKPGLKVNIQKTKIMVYGPITSWLRDGEKMETVTDFIFLGSTITADGEHSHEIKRCLLFGEKKKKKGMTNQDSVLKVHLVKALFFPVAMSGCDSWIIKKAEELRCSNYEAGEDS